MKSSPRFISLSNALVSTIESRHKINSQDIIVICETCRPSLQLRNSLINELRVKSTTMEVHSSTSIHRYIDIEFEYPHFRIQYPNLLRTIRSWRKGHTYTPSILICRSPSLIYTPSRSTTSPYEPNRIIPELQGSEQLWSINARY